MVINCEERYREAMEYAEKTGDKTLQNCLERLERWETNMKGEIHLRKDFAPLSFYFEMYDSSGNRMMNGGVIYHGNPDQSYSYQLIKSIGWEIHT
jgi:hypothetical protein